MKTNLLTNIKVGRVTRCAPSQCIYQPTGAHRVTRPTALGAREGALHVGGLPLLLPLALAVALTLLTHTAFAQTWQTVDDFQYAADRSAQAWALAKDPLGNIYVAGIGNDVAGDHALVMKSSDGGSTWSTLPVDDFTGVGNGAWYSGITSDSAGSLFAAGGYADESAGTYHWLVRRSQDVGITWQTIDDVTGESTTAIATDGTGNIYVAGYGSGYWIVRKGTPDSSSPVGMSWQTVDTYAGAVARSVFCHPTAGVFAVGGANPWTVRRSQNGGSSWTTVDTFVPKNATYALANGICADLSGNLYVVGRYQLNTTHAYRWLTRKSTNGGNSWTTVDDFLPKGAGSSAIANGVGVDASGNVFVVGRARGQGFTSSDWCVRLSAAGTGAWLTVDAFQYFPQTYGSSEALAVVGDASGHVLVTGYGTDANNVQHWLVRKN